MKTLGVSITLVCFLFTGFLMASNSKPEGGREEYQKQIETKLKAFSQKLDALKEKAVEVEKESKEKLHQEIEELRKKQEAASKKMEELKSSSNKAWRKMKKEIDSAMEELEKLYNQAKSRFK